MTAAHTPLRPGYSLGMKQRLGIAAALLKQPRLLILDEPSNGLDPAGIRDVRELVRRLGADGSTTVFLSSHLLAEVEQVCDSVSIMAAGQCVASGAVGQFLAGSTSRQLRLRLADPAGAWQVLERAGHHVSAEDEALLVTAPQDPDELGRLLAEHGHWVRELSPVAVDLEAAFLQLTENRPAPAGGPATEAAA